MNTHDLMHVMYLLTLISGCKQTLLLSAKQDLHSEQKNKQTKKISTVQESILLNVTEVSTTTTKKTHS